MATGRVMAQKLSRADMDIQRASLDYFGQESYEKGNSFLRSDSSYYLGWMFVGGYSYDRAADHIGYSICIPYLLKAKFFLEKDFNSQLRTRATTLDQFYKVQQRMTDYNMICNCLNNAYSITNNNDSAYWIANEYQKFNFQKDLYAYNGSYLTKSWIVFRNRNYTTSNYSFLKSSLSENVKLVFRLLDSANQRLIINTKLNDKLFSSYYNNVDFSNYYHQQSILYSYIKEFDKAEDAFKNLESTGFFSSNNYALLKYAEGDFENAFKNFDENNISYITQKTLEEWIFYESMLYTYNGQNKTSINQLQSWIRKVGSTPGFGWYNIALSRSYLYHGDLVHSSKSLTKAKNFTEYHIGTTLGEDAYKMSINLLDLQLANQQLAAIEFENPYWYFSFEQIKNHLIKQWDVMFKKWWLLNTISNYQDRELILYEFFSAESVATWDEIWSLLHDFSTNFFIEKYTTLLSNPDIPSVVKDHYKYALASLKSDKFNKSDAKLLVSELANSQFSTSSYSSLLYFRILELQKKLGVGDPDTKVIEMYNTYPQLVPFSGYKMVFNLQVVGNENELFAKTLRRMKACNIRFTDAQDSRFPTVIISLINSNHTNYITTTVQLPNKEKVLDNYKISIKDPNSDGIKLAYILFQITEIKENET